MPDPAPAVIEAIPSPGPTGNNTRLSLGAVATALVVVITQIGDAGLPTAVMVAAIVSVAMIAAAMIVADTLRPMRRPRDPQEPAR